MYVSVWVGCVGLCVSSGWVFVCLWGVCGSACAAGRAAPVVLSVGCSPHPFSRSSPHRPPPGAALGDPSIKVGGAAPPHGSSLFHFLSFHVSRLPISPIPLACLLLLFLLCSYLLLLPPFPALLLPLSEEERRGLDLESEDLEPPDFITC